jgi:hypothetical protein
MLDGKRKLREVRKRKAMERKCVFALLLYHKDDLVEGQLQKLSFSNNRPLIIREHRARDAYPNITPYQKMIFTTITRGDDVVAVPVHRLLGT